MKRIGWPLILGSLLSFVAMLYPTPHWTASMCKSGNGIQMEASCPKWFKVEPQISEDHSDWDAIQVVNHAYAMPLKCLPKWWPTPKQTQMWSGAGWAIHVTREQWTATQDLYTYGIGTSNGVEFVDRDFLEKKGILAGWFCEKPRILVVKTERGWRACPDEMSTEYQGCLVSKVHSITMMCVPPGAAILAAEDDDYWKSLPPKTKLDFMPPLPPFPCDPGMHWESYTDGYGNHWFCTKRDLSELGK